MRRLPKLATAYLLLVGLLLAGSVLTLNSSAARAASGEPLVEWTKTYGGEDDDEAFSVIQTSDGGFAIAGDTESYGASEEDFYLVKTDPSGEVQWDKTYGGVDDDGAGSVIQTSDGGFAIAGCTESYGAGEEDFYLVRTDPSGGVQWDKTYGGVDDDGAWSVIQTSDGGFAIAGYTESYGAGYSDFYLVKTNPSGEVQWAKTYGGENRDRADSVIQTSDGGFAIAGWTNSYGAGWADFYLVRTDPSGGVQWAETYGGEDLDIAYSVIQTSDGGFAIAGCTESYGAGGVDFYLVRTDPSGGVQWDKTYGGEDDDGAWSVIQTSDGGFAIAGCTGSYGAGGGDFYLVKTDPSGEVQWDKTHGGENLDDAWSVIQTSDGGFAIAGYTESYGAGYEDLYLAKLAGGGPPRYIPWALVGGVVITIAIVGVFVYLRKR